MTGDEESAAGESERTTDGDHDRPATESMTDTDATETDEPTAAPGSTAAAEPTDGASAESADEEIGRLSTDRLRGILDRLGLAALVLLALVAGWGFYSQAGAAIRTWLDPAYQPIALAAFNLAILLVALAGVGHQLSRIRASE
ncbi:hypothetical protein [Halorubrum yunnanense]|uniref:DUF8060 domain-containing protein n=1 Tax=Halorubrum yunnanense TaxID=1526162 RepID=A0ABD5YDH1_9EURY|nr:hypothetical protein [Halorubrum yunnanense]